MALLLMSRWKLHPKAGRDAGRLLLPRAPPHLCLRSPALRFPLCRSGSRAPSGGRCPLCRGSEDGLGGAGPQPPCGQTPPRSPPWWPESLVGITGAVLALTAPPKPFASRPSCCRGTWPAALSGLERPLQTTMPGSRSSLTPCMGWEGHRKAQRSSHFLMTSALKRTATCSPLPGLCYSPLFLPPPHTQAHKLGKWGQMGFPLSLFQFARASIKKYIYLFSHSSEDQKSETPVSGRVSF
jgi:hypothetical protein